MTFLDLLSEKWQSISQLFTLILQFVQTVVVIIGVPFVIVQIRQQTKALRIQSQSLMLSNYMEMMAEASRVNEMLVDDPDLGDFYDQSKLPKNLATSWDGLNEKYRRFYLYLGRNLSLLERAFVLWDQGWMDDLDYRATLVQLGEIMGLRFFHLWWKNLEPYYRADFVAYVNKLDGKSDEEFFALGLSRSTPKGKRL